MGINKIRKGGTHIPVGIRRRVSHVEREQPGSNAVVHIAAGKEGARPYNPFVFRGEVSPL